MKNYSTVISQKIDIQMTIYDQVSSLIFSVISDSGQLPTPPGILTHAECGCNTVFHTVIDCRLIRCQAAELHIDYAGGFVCSQCDLALELLIVVSTTISRINMLDSMPRYSIL